MFSKTLTELLRHHVFAIVLAFVFGVMMVVPYAALPTMMGSAYQGIQPALQDDELFYLSIVHEAMDGHVQINNPYFLEQKNVQPPQIFLGEWLLAQPLRGLHLNILEGRVLYNGMLPFLICLVVYAIAYVISRSRLQSIAATLVLLFGLFTFVFLRPVSPQLNFLFWLTEFLLLYLLATRKTSWKMTALAAVNLGFLFYLYPYYWTQLAALTGLLVVGLWFVDREKMKRMMWVLGGAAVVAIPYAYFTVKASHELGYTDTLTRVGTIFSHAPGAIVILTLSTVLLVVLAFVHRYRRLSIGPEALFFGASVLSGMIASNQEVVTGKIFQFSMHYHMQVVFGAVFACLYLIRVFESREKRRVWMAVGMCLLFALVFSDGHGFGLYLRSVSTVSENDQLAQRYAPAFAWLNANAKTDAVVYADHIASEYLPVYTSMNVLFADSASNITVTDQEYEDRYLLNNYFESVTPDFVRENERSLFCARYLNLASQQNQQNIVRRVLKQPIVSLPLVPDQIVSEVVDHAKEIQSRDLLEGLARYHVDFVLWDTRRDPNWKLDGRNGFERVFESPEMVIYRVTSTLL